MLIRYKGRLICNMVGQRAFRLNGALVKLIKLRSRAPASQLITKRISMQLITLVNSVTSEATVSTERSVFLRFTGISCSGNNHR